jgi:hypothetical protein
VIRNRGSIAHKPTVYIPDDIFNEFKETDDEEYDPRKPNDYELVNLL